VINNVVLVGRLGNDPELTYTASGTALCKFRLGVTRPPRRSDDGGRGEEETDWLDITCWGRVAETAAQYLDKGSLVGVEGRVQSRTWERQDGSKAYGVDINAQRVDFLESRSQAEARRAGGGGGRPPQQQAPQQQAPQQAAPQQAAPPSNDDWPGEDDQDPFGDQ